MMIPPLEGEIGLGGVTWRVRAPERAVDVLHSDIFLVAKAKAGAGCGMVGPLELAAVQRWCAQYVVDPPDALSLIDSTLSIRQLEDLRAKIVELASLPGETVRQVQQFWYIANSGGCECPVCSGRVERSEENRERMDCRYADIDPDVDRIIDATYSLGKSPAFDAPWWLYQLQQAQARGTAQGLSEERKKKARVSTSHDNLKRRGLLR